MRLRVDFPIPYLKNYVERIDAGVIRFPSRGRLAALPRVRLGEVFYNNHLARLWKCEAYENLALRNGRNFLRYARS